MGKTARPKPARLTEKLLQIRTSLELSQNGMIRRLGLAEELFQGSISGYELGTREPPLPVLLKYAQVAGVNVDVLLMMVESAGEAVEQYSQELTYQTAANPRS